MVERRKLEDLEDLVGRLDQAAQEDQDASEAEDAPEVEEVSLGEILDTVGTRSFGPFVLLAGIVTLMPVISGLPGVPTLMAALVLLVAGQMVCRREHVWLPQWILRRSFAKSKLRIAVRWIRRPAQILDHCTKKRLIWLAGPRATYVMAIVCVVVALFMPLMEFVPFSANGAGITFLAFGLGLIAKDGLLALLAFLSTALTFGFVTYVVLSTTGG